MHSCSFYIVAALCINVKESKLIGKLIAVLSDAFKYSYIPLTNIRYLEVGASKSRNETKRKPHPSLLRMRSLVCAGVSSFSHGMAVSAGIVDQVRLIVGFCAEFVVILNKYCTVVLLSFCGDSCFYESLW